MIHYPEKIMKGQRTMNHRRQWRKIDAIGLVQIPDNGKSKIMTIPHMMLGTTMHFLRDKSTSGANAPQTVFAGIESSLPSMGFYKRKTK